MAIDMMMHGTIGLVIGILGAGAAAAAPLCNVPLRIERPSAEAPTERDPARIVRIGGYTLSMIWMPQHCRRSVPGASSLGCPAATRDGFVLHGLWPDGEGRTWPQWCAPADPLPERVIRAHWCATPSAQLLQHEWAKHGTCMPGYTAQRFLDLSNEMFGQVRFPDMSRLSRRSLTASQLPEALARVNPRLPIAAIQPALDRDGWLEEVRICFDAALRPEPCKTPAPPPATAVRIWRGGR